jgi:hypothetical protein
MSDLLNDIDVHLEKITSLNKEISSVRDKIWDKVAALPTWAERDKAIRHLINETEHGWGLADGDSCERLFERHRKDRAKGAECWEE